MLLCFLLFCYRLRDIDWTLFRALINNLGADDPDEAAKTLDAIIRVMREDEVYLVADSLQRLQSRRPHISNLMTSLTISKNTYVNQCGFEIMKRLHPSC